MPPVLLMFAVAILYAGAALFTLWRLAREWRPLLDADWTARDRELAGQVGFLLLTPVAVWLHEWGHLTVMRLFGATDPTIHYFLYWGYVDSRYPFTAMQEFWVALAGPLVSAVLGWGLLAAALLLPMRPAISLSLANCALATLFLVLVFYPAWSLLGGWGDFVAVYGAGGPTATAVVGLAHALQLALLIWLMSRLWIRGFLAYPRPRPWRLRWVAAPAPAADPPAREHGGAGDERA